MKRVKYIQISLLLRLGFFADECSKLAKTGQGNEADSSKNYSLVHFVILLELLA